MGMEQRQCSCGVYFVTARRHITQCRACRQIQYNETKLARRLRRIEDAPGSHTQKEWLQRIKSQGELCYWCHRRLRDAEGIFHGTRDHLMPLVKGGSDSIDNIVAACWPCNHEKGTKTPGEYRVYLSQQGRPFSEVSVVPAFTEGGTADTRRALKRSRELSTLQAEQRDIACDPHPRNLGEPFRQMLQTLAGQKSMNLQTDMQKKRNQAVADLQKYLAEKRRPEDERERQKLLGKASGSLTG